MKKILLTTICIAFATFSFSQQVSRHVVASGGNYSSNSNHTISSTIAETMATTLSAGSYVLTQGFQQSFSAPVDPTITITNPMDSSIHYCLDNPTIGFVVSNFTVGLPSSGGDGHIHYSVNGTPGPMQYDTTHIQLTNLSNGSYQFIIELVDNSHNSFSPVISDTVNFTINIILGCMDSTATNYDATATCDDGSCTSPIYGCMDATATNYEPAATVDDGSCCYTNWVTLVMTDSYGDGWNGNTWTATSATGGNTYGPFTLSNGYSDSISFCMDHDCFDIICDFGSWQSEVGWTLIENGTSVLTGGAPAIMQIGIGSGSCTTGCTDSLACNYDSTAGLDDGSCVLPDGCTDATACNYDATATCDDGSCEWTSCAGVCANLAPTGLHATNVLQNRATINWDNMNDANCMVDQYRIKYRAVGSSTWSQKNMGQPLNSCLWGANNTDKLILNLTPSTTYEYQMKAWYCDGSGMGVGSSWSAMETFTTEDDCPNVGNLAVTTPSTTKATFTWDDSNGAYSFVRIKVRADTLGGVTWFNVGGMGVNYGIFTKDKNGLVPGMSYRGQGRTWCDPNGGAWKSPTWTSLVYWTMPTVIRLEGGSAIANLDVYPNPSRDIFNVSFTSEDVQDLEVRVINVVGEVVYTESLEQFVGEYTKAIDLATYTKGIYFLEITTNNGVVNKKLILQ